MRARVYLATLAAYTTADFAAPLSSKIGAGVGAHVDPATLVVPFCAAFALAFPAWGAAADRFRAGAALAVSLFGLAAAGVLLALAPSVAVLVVARAAQGAAAAGVPPTVQALLARRAGDGAAGRAVSGMMVAVAVATLGGPLVATPLAALLGWRGASVLLGVAPALAAAIACAPLHSPGAAAAARVRVRPTAALLAGWTCATLVLAAYWTLITRWSQVAGGGASALLPISGALGVLLVIVAGRAADRRGPRRPMVLTMAAGALAYAVAAAATSRFLLLAGASIAVAAYWGYLPVVAAQVQRAAPDAARASAAGILYSSMWLGAAVGGLAASAAHDPRAILAGAAVSWALAAVVAWRGFESAPMAAT